MHVSAGASGGQRPEALWEHPGIGVAGSCEPPN